MKGSDIIWYSQNQNCRKNVGHYLNEKIINVLESRVVLPGQPEATLFIYLQSAFITDINS
jgi:hypothetical protein